jgi:Protein of unknown function (DUF1186)/SEC-C motif
MQILDQLGAGKGLPVAAMRAADAHRAEVLPVFLQAIEMPTPDKVTRDALFFVFHLLGQWREKSAYRPLAAFLHSPTNEIGQVLGDAVTETSHRVMAAVFDGDPQPLYDVILDSEADEFARKRMIDALTMVTLRGELPREETARFLRSCYSELQPQDECFVWDGWQGAISTLGLTELKPLVEQAFERGFISPMWLAFKDFEEDLQQALDGRPAPLWHGRDEFELFGDTIEELSRWYAFAPERETKRQARENWSLPATPYAQAENPFKDIGRNDPCPCGSGKKFKKCCLGKSESPSPEIEALLQAPSDTRKFLGGASEGYDVFDDGDLFQEYDPLVEPDPEGWLNMDEQERMDLILAYHRRESIELPNEKAHATFHTIIENQIAEGDELPVRRTVQRLMTDGLDRHEAIHAVGLVLAEHIGDLLREADQRGQPTPDRDPNDAYFAALARLTAEDWRRSGDLGEQK